MNVKAVTVVATVAITHDDLNEGWDGDLGEFAASVRAALHELVGDDGGAYVPDIVTYTKEMTNRMNVNLDDAHAHEDFLHWMLAPREIRSFHLIEAHGINFEDVADKISEREAIDYLDSRGVDHDDLDGPDKVALAFHELWHRMHDITTTTTAPGVLRGYVPQKCDVRIDQNGFGAGLVLALRPDDMYVVHKVWLADDGWRAVGGSTLSHDRDAAMAAYRNWRAAGPDDSCPPFVVTHSEAQTAAVEIYPDLPTAVGAAKSGGQ